MLFSGHLLVAEDSLTNQEVMKYILESLGLQVDVVGNGREAVDAFSKHTYDLIFLDCKMPEVDGYEAAKKIREMEFSETGQHQLHLHGEPSSTSRVRRIPIIAVTARMLDYAREECLAAGMDDCLGKPHTRAELCAIMDRWLPLNPNPVDSRPCSDTMRHASKVSVDELQKEGVLPSYGHVS